MRYTILCVGKIKEKYFTDAIAEYKKRLSRYADMEIIEVADEKTPDQAWKESDFFPKSKIPCMSLHWIWKEKNTIRLLFPNI